MTYLLQQALNALQLGSIYALIALGYTMVYGILRMINFAHGDLFMVGAFFCFMIATYLKLPFVPTLLLSMMGVGLLGVGIERVAYKPLRNAPRVSAVITALGVGIFLENLTLVFLPLPAARARASPQHHLDDRRGDDLILTDHYYPALRWADAPAGLYRPAHHGRHGHAGCLLGQIHCALDGGSDQSGDLIHVPDRHQPGRSGGGDVQSGFSGDRPLYGHPDRLESVHLGSGRRHRQRAGCHDRRFYPGRQ